MKLNSKIKEEIIRLFKKGKTTKEVADELHIHPETVKRHLRKNNIPIFKGTVSEFIEIGNDLKQLLIGSLLGDGSFCYSSKKTKHCYLSIAHCMRQKEYLEFKKSILDNYGLGTPLLISTYIDNRFKNPKYTECREKSKLHPIFTNIRLKYYDQNGFKRVFKEFVDSIDSLGLAIWYMDDGSVTNNSCILSTCSFSLDEQRILSEILLNKFNLHFTIGRNSNSMYLLAEDFPKFVKLIKPYVIPSMQYKLIPYSKRVHVKSDELLEACDGNQQPSTPLTKCEGSETNS